MISSLLSLRKTRGNRALAALHPAEPWLWRKDWAEGKINSTSGQMTLFLFLFALFWNIVSAPAWFVLQYEIFRPGNRLAFLALLFPVIGLILIGCLLVSALRLRKYGHSVFEMAAVPGVTGGQIAGVIRVSKKVEPEEGFRLVLKCVQRITTGNGKSSNTSENILWQDEQLITRELSQDDPEQSAIPVLFQIPCTCRPSDDSNANDVTVWRLEASAKTPGLDYASKFEVPVFETPESDPNFVVDESLIADYAAPADPDRDLRAAGVIKTESPSGEGFRLIFPMARTPGMGLLLLAMGVLFGCVPIVMYELSAPWLLNVIFGVVFGAIGLFGLVGTADVWFYRSTVDVSAHGLTITGGLFGLGRAQRIEAANITQIAPNSRMSSGESVYYDIEVVCQGGKKVTAGKRILGKRLAEAVIRQIEQAMGKL
jgi:hypothetical protein